MTDLHAAIMNIPCCPYRTEPDFVIGYKFGHRDARHAAAELAVLPRAELSDEEITHLWDTRVGDPTPRYPLTNGDVIAFAKSILAASKSKPCTE